MAAAAATPVIGPGIMPGTVKLQPLPDTYVRWMRSNVSRQRQDGYCHVTVRLPLGDFTAGQMRVLADLAEAYGDGTMRLTVEQNVLYPLGEDGVRRAVLPAAGRGGPRRARRRHAERRRQLPGRGELPPGGDAVARARPGAHRVPERASGPRRLVPSGNIKISGCPNGCGQHHIASIGFQGSVRKVGGRAVPQYFVLVGGGCADDGRRALRQGRVEGAGAPADRRASIGCCALSRAASSGDEELGAFFRRVPPAVATDALKDLAQLLPNETTEQDFIDLGESQAFNPEVMDGECSRVTVRRFEPSNPRTLSGCLPRQCEQSDVDAASFRLDVQRFGRHRR